MSGSNHENRSLSADGPDRQLPPRDRSFDDGASIVAARATALAPATVAHDPGACTAATNIAAYQQTFACLKKLFAIDPWSLAPKAKRHLMGSGIASK